MKKIILLILLFAWVRTSAQEQIHVIPEFSLAWQRGPKLEALLVASLEDSAGGEITAFGGIEVINSHVKGEGFGEGDLILGMSMSPINIKPFKVEAFFAFKLVGRAEMGLKTSYFFAPRFSIVSTGVVFAKENKFVPSIGIRGFF